MEWNDFEPQPGKFVWGRPNKQAQEIDRLLASGLNVIPSIRAKSAWAVRDARGAKCARAPLDLDTRKPLRAGERYSESYFRFVTNVARRYKGKFEIVVIENEMNDPDFWCASTDEYLRLFLTARQAFHEVDPAVKVADGGVQGAALNWLVVQNYVDRGEMSAAIAFYGKFTGKPITRAALGKQAARWQAKLPVRRAAELFASRLFEWSDIVNFHYYQRSDALGEIVAYLKERAPSKPLMTNEVGIKEKYSGNLPEASRQMVKKCATLLALGVEPVIWFTPGGKKDNNGGALVDEEGNLVAETRNSFEAISRFLGRPRRSCQDLSTEALTRFSFAFPDGVVDVVWPNDAVTSAAITVDTDRVAYSYQNQQLSGRRVPPTAAPLFLVKGAGLAERISR